MDATPTTLDSVRAASERSSIAAAMAQLMVAATAPLYRARTAVSLAELDAEIARARTLINSAREMRRELDRLSLADTAVHAENAP